MQINARATKSPNQPLERYSYDPGPLGPDDVESAFEACGLRHSDVSVMNNEWGISTYPVIPGHEVIGKVVALGSNAKGLQIGQRVGVGWGSGSCMHCAQCQNGEGNLCEQNVPTIVGHFGGFADRVRAQWPWAVPIPEGHNPADAGPLLCGGVTVVAPLKVFDIKPTDCVGIGGLGHLALKFAKAWGCEVTAFTSTDSKADEARSFGAHRVVNSRKPDDIKKIAGTLDMLLVTVNVPLDWTAMLATLRPKGRLHFVGDRARADPDQRLRHYPDAAKRIGIAQRIAADGGTTDAGVRGASQHPPTDRAFPDCPRERCDQASARREGTLPRRSGRVGIPRQESEFESKDRSAATAIMA
jgi:alcohol/geraniol dehydrogenase (NADP+)